MAIPINNKILQPADSKSGQKQGTGFTNLSRILQANRSNRLGQVVNQGVGNIAQDAKSNVQKSQEQFTKDTQEAFKPYQGGEEFYKGAILDPTSTVQNQQGFDRFRRIASGDYVGPDELQNTGALTSKVQNVQDLARLSGTSGGKEALLQSFIKNPNYAAGQRRLDTLLLGNKDLQGLRGLASSTTRDFANAQEVARAQANINENIAQQQSQGLKETLVKEQEARDKELADKLAAEQTAEIDRKAKLDALKSNLEQSQLTKEQAQALGIDIAGKDFINLFGVNPQDLVNYRYSDLPTSKEAIASQEQAARLNALNRLAGNEGNIFDPTKVGSFQASGSTFDLDKFRQGTEAYEDRFQRASKELDAYNKYFGGASTRLNQETTLGNVLIGSGIKSMQDFINAKNTVLNPQSEQFNKGLYDKIAATEGGRYLFDKGSDEMGREDVINRSLGSYTNYQNAVNNLLQSYQGNQDLNDQDFENQLAASLGITNEQFKTGQLGRPEGYVANPNQGVNVEQLLRSRVNESLFPIINKLTGRLKIV